MFPAITDKLRKQVATHVSRQAIDPLWGPEQGLPFIYALAQHLAAFEAITKADLGPRMAILLPGFDVLFVHQMAHLLVGCDDNKHLLFVDLKGWLRSYEEIRRVPDGRLNRQECI